MQQETPTDSEVDMSLCRLARRLISIVCMHVCEPWQTTPSNQQLDDLYVSI